MKKTLILLFVCLLGINVSFAQTDDTKKEEGYKFTNLKEIPITSVTDHVKFGITDRR